MATTFAVPDGRVAMAATLYTGTGAGSPQSISNAVNAVSFQPGLVWVKARNANGNNAVTDYVRGAYLQLITQLTNAEANYSPYGVTAFNANGFGVNDDNAGNYSVNGAAGGLYSGTPPNYVAWQWKAGGTAVSNTAGTITSSVSANTTAGFSVVTFTSPATSITFTVGHGLGVAPAMIFIKDRGQASYWGVYHSGATTNNNTLYLNTTNAVTASTSVWGTALPTNAVFGSYSGVGTQLNDTCVAYCWAPVAGYSAFGKYTGNASADGPFVYTGFKPRYVMRKRTDSATDGSWIIYDTSRITYNANNLVLFGEASSAEVTGAPIDILSNGFKLRDSAAGNVSGGTYIYAAFAESAFNFATAS